MISIQDIKAREILDSKGEPALEVEVLLSNKITATASVPSGSSIGRYEALELRDNNLNRFFGKGVLKAKENINKIIKKSLVGENPLDQEKVDKIMIMLDDTENKKALGANAILGVSLAVCRAASYLFGEPLYQYLGEICGNKDFQIPSPLILINEGGKHGDWATDIQEFFIIPNKKKFFSFLNQIEEVYKILKTYEKFLKEKDYSITVGYEGAYAPREIISNEEAFLLIRNAIEKAGFKMNEDVFLGVDIAASEFFKNQQYFLKRESLCLNSKEWLDYLISWQKKHSLYLIEDPFSEEDWESWVNFNAKIGDKCLIVGDDLLATNLKRIKLAYEKKAVNAVLIKPNQIGTLTETIEAIKFCRENNLKVIISHRSGETNDDFIADLAVGGGADFVKFGGLYRGERLAKYNRLLKIEEMLE